MMRSASTRREILTMMLWSHSPRSGPTSMAFQLPGQVGDHRVQINGRVCGDDASALVDHVLGDIEDGHDNVPGVGDDEYPRRRS